MASILIPPRIQFIDANGEVLAGGKIYTYEAGTSTPKATWKDQEKVTLNAYPVILNSQGRAQVWIDGAYKVVIKDENDELIYEDDNVISYSDADLSGLTATVDDLNTTGAIAEIFYSSQSPTLADRSKVFLMDATSGNLDINLLSITSLLDAEDKYRITIKKVDKSINYVDVKPNGIQKIDGKLYCRLYDYNDFVELIPDGSNWNIISSRIRGTIVTKSSDFSVNLEDNSSHFNCDATTGVINVTLAACSTLSKGFEISFKKIDGIDNSIIITPDGSDLIDGKPELIIHSQNEGYSIKTNGFDWYILNEFIAPGFTTGDVKTTFKISEVGWVKMDDGSIGNAVSGATTRANEDTKNLFILLYLNVSDEFCPVSGGRSGTTEVDAINDFNNGKTLTLPISLGRAMCNYGNGVGLTNRELGEKFGDEEVAITVPQLPVHYHIYHQSYSDFTTGDLGRQHTHNDEFLPATGNAFEGIDDANNEPHPNMQPSIFMNFLIKL